MYSITADVALNRHMAMGGFFVICGQKVMIH